jgi:hypothetical protein
VTQSGDFDAQEEFVETLRQRVATLEGMAAGFGRPSLARRWASAFGSVVCVPKTQTRT